MYVYGVAKVSLYWDDKRDPPLDHRMLDQWWISGRFLVDCSESELFSMQVFRLYLCMSCSVYFWMTYIRLDVKCTL